MLLYAFMNSNQSLQNSMVGIIAFVMLLQNLGRQSGFLWGLAFSAANSLSKGRTPSYIGVTRCRRSDYGGADGSVCCCCLPL